MVSTKTKLKYSAGKLSRAGGKLLPIFARDRPSDLVDEILREDEYIRSLVIQNPEYRGLLERNVSEAFKKYRGVIYGARVVDSWDRVTSALGLIGDAVGPFSAGAGNLFSAGEEIVEGIPKGIYALYYLKKTGDKKAIPLWAGAEAASFIPYVGDAIDMTNIYVNRARRMTKEKAKEEFRRNLNLEARVSYREAA
jgi:hypothetical protein